MADSPGYHISPSGKIYSDDCSSEDLRGLRRRIHRDFYTPGQLARVARKGIQNGAFGFLPHTLPRLPLIAAAASGHAWRGFRRRTMKRLHQATTVSDPRKR